MERAWTLSSRREVSTYLKVALENNRTHCGWRHDGGGGGGGDGGTDRIALMVPLRRQVVVVAIVLLDLVSVRCRRL
jgi:hypothetical protein